MAAPLDSGNVDTALINVLANDATLKSMLPDGVSFSQAPQGSKRYVLVTILDHVDRGVFNDGGFEVFRYFVKAVGLSTLITVPQMRQAAYRIHQLLHQAQVPVTGYPAPASFERLRYERFEERDSVDASLVWYHRGGHYLCHAPH